ncbi:MAG: hypothetical protein JW909_03250 [Planctomycetes bacterium]|nr:hypothetical protein [Planctomycetota bacterium]
MKETILPGPMKKREMLYSPTVSPDDKTAMGRAFLEAGFVSDALAFFVEARSKNDLLKMRDYALAEGDAFILRAVGNASPDLVSEDHWKAVAETAERLGKEAFMHQATNGGKVEMPVVDAVIQEDPTIHGDDDSDGDTDGNAPSENLAPDTRDA